MILYWSHAEPPLIVYVQLFNFCLVSTFPIMLSALLSFSFEFLYLFLSWEAKRQNVSLTVKLTQTNCVCRIPHSPASATFVSEIIYHVPVVIFTFSCLCARAYSLLCVRLFICMCFICPSVFIQSLCGEFLAGEANARQPQYSHTHAMCNPTEKSPTHQRRGMRQRHVRA